MEQIVNVLAQRYASNSLKEIWSGEGRIIMERDLWISVLKAQKELEYNIFRVNDIPTFRSE